MCSPEGSRRRSALITGEVAVAVVLMVGAGLLVRSFIATASVDIGFATAGAVAMTVNAPRQKYQDDASRRALYDQMLERMQSIGGRLEDSSASSTRTSRSPSSSRSTN